MIFSKGILLHTIKAAKRDMLLIGNMIMISVVSFFSVFMGSVSIAEQLEMKITYIASAARIVVALGMIIFVCFHIKRLFENREIEMIMSKSLSRTTILISLIAGFTVLSIIPIVFSSLILSFIVVNKIGLIMWAVSLFFETALLVAFATFFALFIESAVFSLMLCFSFYLVSRTIGSFSAYINILDRLKEITIWTSLAEVFIKIISIILPRLDFCSKATWLIYDIDPQAILLFANGIAQCVIFIPLITLVAIHDFKKRNF